MITLHSIKKGFTLLETLASIAILSIVVIGPLSVTINSSSYARVTKDTIVATYLAEEAIEMLQNQYDSLYVYCKKNASSTETGGFCEPTALETTTGQTSWRLFKDKLSGVGGQRTCYLPKNSSYSYPGNAAGNPNGCALDYVDMTASSTETLVRYDAESASCSYLVPVSSSTSRYVTDGSVSMPGGGTSGNDGGGLTGGYWVNATSTKYVCSGVPSHVTSGGRVEQKQYARTITVDQLPTFETGAANTQYNDDIRITSNVRFKALNGTSHNVVVTRFMHARP